jgi:hypothetical protein
MQWKFIAAAFALTTGLMTGTASLKAHPALPVGCSDTTRTGCAYTPAQSFAQTDFVDLVLTDPARNNYQLPVRVRYPVGTSARLPVIIYNHGGGASDSAGRQANSQPWPIVWAKAGYVVISPSRAPLTTLSQAQKDECTANGWAIPGECVYKQAWLIYGPANTNFIISRFPQLGSLHPPLSALMDEDRVIVAGWSGGSTIPLANAGARRQFVTGGAIYNQSTSAPLGFFGISTMGPDYAGFDGGFFSEGYDTIDARPFLTLTGKGDLKEDKPSEGRTTAWMRGTPGGKLLSWNLKLLATHGTMNLSDCGTASKLLHCDWMRSVGLAFVDAVAKNRASAKTWLASDAYTTLTGGNIELHRR